MNVPLPRGELHLPPTLTLGNTALKAASVLTLKNELVAFPYPQYMDGFLVKSIWL